MHQHLVRTAGELRALLDGLDDNDKVRFAITINDHYTENVIVGSIVEADMDTIIFHLQED